MPIPPNRDPLPPPPDWDTFQRLTREVFARIWNDPNAQLNGRSGQAQKGVDVYGQPKKLGGSYEGVQCKRYNVKSLTRQIIESEARDAEAFEPSLAKLYIATSKLRDAKVQATERNIRDTRERQGKFPVYVKFWEDIWDELRKHDDLVADYYPDLITVFEPFTPSHQQLIGVMTKLDQLRSNYLKSIEGSFNDQLKVLRLEVNNGFAEAARPKILALVEQMEFEHRKTELDPSLRASVYRFAALVFVTNSVASNQQQIRQWLMYASNILDNPANDKQGIIEALQLYQSNGAQFALDRLKTLTSDDAERVRFGIWLEIRDFDSCRVIVERRSDLVTSPPKDWQRVLALYHAEVGNSDTAKAIARELAKRADNADHLMMAAYAMAALAYREFKRFCGVHHLCPSVHITDLYLEPLIDADAKQLAADWFARAFWLFQAQECHESALQALEASLRLSTESNQTPNDLVLELKRIVPQHPLLWVYQQESTLSEKQLGKMLEDLSLDPDLILGAVVLPWQKWSPTEAAKLARTLKQYSARFGLSDAVFAHYLITMLALLDTSAHASAIRKWVEDTHWPDAFPHLGLLLRAFLIRKTSVISASQALDELLQKYPSNPEVLIFATRHYQDLKERVHELTYARGLFNAIRTAQTGTLLLDALLANKDFRGSYDLIRQIADLRLPEELVRRARAYSAKAIGEFAEAQQDYEWLASHTECQFEDYIFGARVNQVLGDNQKAIALLRQCVDKYPNVLEGYIALARTCLSAGQTSDAFRWALTAKQHFPDDPAAAAYLLQVIFPAGDDDHPITKEIWSGFAPDGPFADSDFLRITSIDEIQKIFEQGIKSSKAAEELYRQSQIAVGTLCYLIGQTLFKFHYVGNRYRFQRYLGAGDQSYHDSWLLKQNPIGVTLDYTALLTLWSLYEESWLTQLQAAFQEIYISTSMLEAIQIELDELSHQGQLSAQLAREKVLSVITRFGPSKVEVHSSPNFDPLGAKQEVSLADAKCVVYLCEYPDASAATPLRCGLRLVADALLNAGAITIIQHEDLTKQTQPIEISERQAVTHFVAGADIVADPETLQRFASCQALDELIQFVGKVHVVQGAITLMQRELDEHRLHDEVVQSLRRLQFSLGQALQHGEVKAMAAPATERERVQEPKVNSDSSSDKEVPFNLRRQLIATQLVDLLYIAKHKEVPIWTDDRWTSKLYEAHLPGNVFGTDSYIEWQRRIHKGDLHRFTEYEKLINWGYSGLPVNTDYLLWLLKQNQSLSSPRVLKVVNTYRTYVIEVWRMVRENKVFPHELAFQVYGSFHQALIRVLQFCQRSQVSIEQCAELFKVFDLARQTPLAEGMEPAFYSTLLMDAFVREPVETLNPREDAEWAEGFGHWFHSVLETSGVSPILIQEAWHQLVANMVSQYKPQLSKIEMQGLRRWIYILFLAAPNYVQTYLLNGELRSDLALIHGDELERHVVFTATVGDQIRRYPIPQREWDRDLYTATHRFLQDETTDWIVEGCAAVRMNWLSPGSAHVKIEEISADLLKANPNATGHVTGLWVLPMAYSDDPVERKVFWHQGLKALGLAGVSIDRWLELQAAFEDTDILDDQIVAEAHRLLLSNFEVFEHMLRDASRISWEAVLHILVNLEPQDIQAWLDMPEIDWASADSLIAWAQQTIDKVIVGVNSNEEKIEGVLTALKKFGHTLFPDAGVWQQVLSTLLTESRKDKLEVLTEHILRLAQSTPSLSLKVTLSLACANGFRFDTCEALPVALTKTLDAVTEQIASASSGTDLETYVRLHEALHTNLYTRWASDAKFMHLPELALAYLAYVGAGMIVQELQASGRPSSTSLELLRQNVLTETEVLWLHRREVVRQPLSAFKPAWNVPAKYPFASWINRVWRAGLDQVPLCSELTVTVIREIHQANQGVRSFMPGVDVPLSWFDELLYEPSRGHFSAEEAMQLRQAIVDSSLASADEKQVISVVVLCFLLGDIPWTDTSSETVQHLLAADNIAKIKRVPTAYQELLWKIAKLLVTQTDASPDVLQTASARLFDASLGEEMSSNAVSTQATVLAQLATRDLFVDKTTAWLLDVVGDKHLTVSTACAIMRPFITAWPHFPDHVQAMLHSPLLEFAGSPRFQKMWEVVRLQRDITQQPTQVVS